MIRRLGIIAISLLIAALAGHDATLAYRRHQAAQALDAGRAGELAPGWLKRDPTLRVMAAQAALGRNQPPPGGIAALDTDARAALRRDPLDASALHQIGLAAEARQPGTGTPFFTLASRISRRDWGNELVLERFAAAAGDNDAALARIDHAVSVVPALGASIFPALVPALADPRVRQAMIARASRPWYPEVIDAAITRGADPLLVAQLLKAAAPYQPRQRLEQLNFALLTQTIRAGQYDAARGVVAVMPPAARQAVAAIGFSPASTDPKLAPLTWKLLNDGPASVHLTGANSLTVTISAEHNAIVAERWTLIAPGQYSVSLTLGYDPRSAHAGVAWDVMCAGGNTPAIGGRALRGGATRSDRWDLTIPAGCGAQIWHLKAYGDTGPSLVTISDLAITRQGGGR